MQIVDIRRILFYLWPRKLANINGLFCYQNLKFGQKKKNTTYELSS